MPLDLNRTATRRPLPAQPLSPLSARPSRGRGTSGSLETRNFPVKRCAFWPRPVCGRQMAFRGQQITVEELTEASFDGVDYALFSAGSGLSKTFAPIACGPGRWWWTIPAPFRMDPDVPLWCPR